MSATALATVFENTRSSPGEPRDHRPSFSPIGPGPQIADRQPCQEPWHKAPTHMRTNKMPFKGQELHLLQQNNEAQGPKFGFQARLGRPASQKTSRSLTVQLLLIVNLTQSCETSQITIVDINKPISCLCRSSSLGHSHAGLAPLPRLLRRRFVTY